MSTGWLADAFAQIGVDELRRRKQEAATLLEQDGVVYNAYNESPTPGRSWRLDPLPHVLDSRTWARIERGLIERAELLNLILEDLYGPRDLLRRGLLPPQLIYGDPGFIRAADQIRLHGGQMLFNYAADIAWDLDGEPVVTADRSQAPSGQGFAMENRSVISKVLPSMYREAEVHRLAPFFRALRSSLQDAAPVRATEPRIVVLTPGPLNETAYEHAALASTLGFPLVQGSDLTVRNDRVWMRSVGRLEPVDVILRRVDGSYCDPLELRPNSQLGVAGLLEVARSGNVSIVNPIGAGILENPAMLAFVPAIARHLLGIELQLPSLRSWWCGDDESRKYVLEHLDELVLRPVLAGRRTRTLIPGFEISQDRRRNLRRQILAAPDQWAAHEWPSMLPVSVVTDSGLQESRSLVRAFAVARRGSYVVMTGGLTRVQALDESASGAGFGMRLSGQAGAISKDTWVLASEPEPTGAFWLRSGPAVVGVNPMSSMPARAAESLWWLGRYAERAEGQARLARTALGRAREFASVDSPAGAATVVVLEQALASMAAGQDTFAQPVAAVLQNAQAVREQLSRDTWLALLPLQRALPLLNVPVTDLQAHRQSLLQEVMQALLAFSGIGNESMVRDIGWYFMDAGRRLERALQTLRLLRATVAVARDQATDSIVLESLLSAAESIITYRFRYRSQAQLETVLELLLLDSGNPRSLTFQFERLHEDFERLPLAGGLRLSAEQALLLDAHTQLRLADLEALSQELSDGQRPQLTALFDNISACLTGLATELEVSRFPHTLPTVSLVGAAGAEPSILHGV